MERYDAGVGPKLLRGVLRMGFDSVDDIVSFAHVTLSLSADQDHPLRGNNSSSRRFVTSEASPIRERGATNTWPVQFMIPAVENRLECRPRCRGERCVPEGHRRPYQRANGAALSSITPRCVALTPSGGGTFAPRQTSFGRGAAARFSLSLIASPNPSSGIGATAMREGPSASSSRK